MKKILMITLWIFSIVSTAQKINFEPIGGISVDLNKTEEITQYKTNETMKIALPYSAGKTYVDLPELTWRSNYKISYETIVGFRLTYKRMMLESINTFYIVTNDFIKNCPYLADFKLRLYYKYKGLKFGIEHLCIHKINSKPANITYSKRGGHNKVFITYNL